MCFSPNCCEFSFLASWRGLRWPQQKFWAFWSVNQQPDIYKSCSPVLELNLQRRWVSYLSSNFIPFWVTTWQSDLNHKICVESPWWPYRSTFLSWLISIALVTSDKSKNHSCRSCINHEKGFQDANQSVTDCWTKSATHLCLHLRFRFTFQVRKLNLMLTFAKFNSYFGLGKMRCNARCRKRINKDFFKTEHDYNFRVSRQSDFFSG